MLKLAPAMVRTLPSICTVMKPSSISSSRHWPYRYASLEHKRTVWSGVDLNHQIFFFGSKLLGGK